MGQAISNLALGSKIKFGKYSVNGEEAQPISWIIVAKNHGGYPSNSVTLLSEYAIDKLMADVGEVGRPLGWNYYGSSDIDHWLNIDSAGGTWYSNSYANEVLPYKDRPGFLNAFSSLEKQCILTTTIKSIDNNDEMSSISRKVFIPSVVEIGGQSPHGMPEGSQWSYLVGTKLIVNYSQQARDNQPAVTTAAAQWWTRTKYDLETADTMYAVDTKGGYNSQLANSAQGIRPALNVVFTSSVTDTTDSEGYYTIIFNEAPPTPSSFFVPTTIYGGKTNSISWSSVTDPNEDVVTYHLECSIDGGEYIEIFSGTATIYAHLVPFGITSVTYRIKATDPSGESSAYTASESKTVINNYAPVISGTDGNLGVKSEGFAGTYTVTDANSDAVTVTEAIDGVQIRSLVATLGQEITYGVTENTWLALPNGSHTLTISATDGIDTTVRTYVFTKLVETLKIMNTAPWEASTMPSRIMLVVTRNIPSASTFKVEVCNNGYDSSPTWEDATDAVVSGLAHVFSNAKKTASLWGVRVRVTVARNGATGACYISAIGGNFE